MPKIKILVTSFIKPGEVIIFDLKSLGFKEEGLILLFHHNQLLVANYMLKLKEDETAKRGLLNLLLDRSCQIEDVESYSIDTVEEGKDA